MPYRSLANASKLAVIDFLFCVPIMVCTYFFYALPPFSLLLRNYYRPFFAPLLILSQTFLSLLVWIGINYGYYALHNISFFSLPVSDRYIFFVWFVVATTLSLLPLIPLFKIAIPGVYEQDIVYLSGTFQKNFENALYLLPKHDIELFLEAPEKRLIIGQLDVEVDQGKKQTCMIEICFSSKTILFDRTYAHVMCYPASKKAYIQQAKLASIVHMISQGMHLKKSSL